MREILFRGKRWADGGWSIGDLLQHRSGETIIHSYVNGCRVADAVAPSTVGQYTGLKDKNGERIFEGDIIRHYNNLDGDPNAFDVGVIRWDEKHTSFERTSNPAPVRISSDCRYEVFGNIHDNPELLEGGENG